MSGRENEAGVASGAPAAKNTVKKKVITVTVCVLLGVALLVLAFFGGYWVRGSFTDSLSWVKSVIEQYYYKEIEGDMDEVAADALVKEYLDIYSAYYTAEEYAAQQSANAGNKSGFGLSCTYYPGRGIVVVNSVGNSPAYAAGLRNGDVIVSAEYEGKDYAFNSYEDFSSYTDLVGDGQANFILDDGTSIVCSRAEYATSYVFMATNDNAWTFTGNDALTITESAQDAISYLPDGAAYISLSQFYGSAPRQFDMAAEVFNAEGCTSLILDLRNDGGGYVSVMQKIAGCFEGCVGTAMEARYKDGSVSRYDVEESKNCIPSSAEVYILANSNTASASEALTGVLVSYDVTDYGDIYISEYSQEYLDTFGVTAEQVKSGKTYGKGIMQSTFVNPFTHEALKLTTAQIYWPDGTTIHGRGLSAEDGCNTVEAPMPISGDGEELQAAVAAIYGN